MFCLNAVMNVLIEGDSLNTVVALNYSCSEVVGLSLYEWKWNSTHLQLQVRTSELQVVTPSSTELRLVHM